MSGIYIPGMGVPKDGMLEFAITDTGAVILTSRSVRVDGSEYFEPLVTPQELYRAIPVPDHGDLIDKSGVDVLSWTDGEYGTDFADGVLFVLDKLDELPVIIPAEGEDYEAPADKEGDG